MPEEIKDAGSWNGFVYHKDKLAALRKPLFVSVPTLLDLLTALTGMNGFVVEGLFEFYEHLNDTYTKLLTNAFIKLSTEYKFSEMLDNTLASLQSDGYMSTTEKQVVLATLKEYGKYVAKEYIVWEDDLAVIEKFAPNTYDELMKELLDCVSQKNVKEAIEITFAEAWVHGNLKNFTELVKTRSNPKTDFCNYGGFSLDTDVNYVDTEEAKYVVQYRWNPTAKEVYDKKFSVNNF